MNPNEVCEGLYLKKGTYGDVHLKEDSPVKFISSSHLELKCLPGLAISRNLLRSK